MTRFGIILDILSESFHGIISEQDYVNIVNLLRDYDRSRDDTSIEKQELVDRGWPLNYHPCDHMERIRFATVFGKDDNVRIKELFSTLSST